METKLPKFSRREWIFLFLLSAASWLQSCIFSLQGPFYPPEAESKGLTPSVYGTVMGFYRLTSFVLCLFFGVYVEKIGLRRCFMMGLLFAGLAPFLFGFLAFLESYSLFLTFSFLLRGLEGAGNVGIKASSCMIIGLVFPGRLAVCIALMEACFVLGISIGPVLGALLFDVGGFTLAFAGFGFIQLLFFILAYVFLPELPAVEDVQHSMKEALQGFLRFLRIPSILLFILAAVVTSISMDFLSAILEPDLTQFNLSPMETSLAFLLIGPFQILSPGWGYVLDRTSRGELITLLGSLITTLSLVIVGPVSFIPVNSSLAITSAGLLLFGLGQGALMVSCFSKIVHEAKENGLSESRTSMIFVASYYIASQALGGAIGPTVAGVLYDNYGFRGATIFPLTCFCLLCILLLIYIASKNKPSQYRELRSALSNGETSPLLN